MQLFKFLFVLWIGILERVLSRASQSNVKKNKVVRRQYLQSQYLVLGLQVRMNILVFLGYKIHPFLLFILLPELHLELFATASKVFGSTKYLLKTRVFENRSFVTDSNPNAIDNEIWNLKQVYGYFISFEVKLVNPPLLGDVRL